MHVNPDADRSHTPRAGRRGARLALPLAALTTLVLTACGLVPPVEVQDPLGLDGEEVAVTFAGAAPTALAPAAVAGTGEVTITFPDLDLSDIPVSPGRLTNEFSIASATLDAGEADAPETIVLSDLDLQVWVWQGAGSYAEAAEEDRATFALEGAGEVTLTRGTCAEATCAYSYAGSTPAFGTVQLTGEQLGATLRVAGDAPEPNGARVRIATQGEPDSLAGRTLTIELDAAEGSIGL